MTPIDAMARTAWGEARNQGSAGMAAVCWVIRNRADRPGWWGNDIVSVCQKRLQFSCWNESDPNRAKLLAVTEADPYFAMAVEIAGEVIAGLLPDPTGGATHYHTLTSNPEWSLHLQKTVEIGDHVFFKEV